MQIFENVADKDWNHIGSDERQRGHGSHGSFIKYPGLTEEKTESVSLGKEKKKRKK